jgi:superfamily I DNA/RNA helicase
VIHAVVFPSGDIKADVGLYGGSGTTITESDLVDMPSAIARVVSHWGERAQMTPNDMKAITDLLAPTMIIRSRLRAKVGRTEAELLKLTQQQLVAVDGLRRSRRVLVTGGPGTGKTIIGVHRARTLADQGLEVLLTCYNQPLAERLATEVAGTTITTRTFHSLCQQQAHSASLGVPSDPSPDWWSTEAADLLIAATDKTGLKFDALVIDEGQDFSPNWFAALELLLSNQEDGFVLLLVDGEQSIYRQDWENIPKLNEYLLDVNCRSSLPIVRKVARVFESQQSNLGTSGPDPVYLTANNAEDTFATVQQAVARLVDEELIEATSVTVLCARRALLERLRGSSVGSAVFSSPGKTGVAVETIHRFKGLESEVVLLCLDGVDLLTHFGRCLAYVGMSRARSLLVVVGSKEAQRSLNW